MIDIYENDNGTIQATAGHQDFDIDEIMIQAEYEPGCAGTSPRYNRATANLIDPGEPSWPASCEITRVYIQVMSDLQIDIPMTAISQIVKGWEREIIEELEHI